MENKKIKCCVNSIEMTPREIIDMITALSAVVEANRGVLGDHNVMVAANRKIKYLMGLIF